MNGKLVIVGEAPSGESLLGRPGLALTGGSGRNLCAIAGWDWLEYLRHTERRNLFIDPMPVWDRKAARVSADELTLALEGRTVIVLGAKVAEAFDLGEDPDYRWLHLDWADVARVPHPSGRNRLWNSPQERKLAREFLHGLLP
jgi:uracil-DNA glycosylase